MLVPDLGCKKKFKEVCAAPYEPSYEDAISIKSRPIFSDDELCCAEPYDKSYFSLDRSCDKSLEVSSQRGKLPCCVPLGDDSHLRERYENLSNHLSKSSKKNS